MSKSSGYLRNDGDMRTAGMDMSRTRYAPCRRLETTHEHALDQLDGINHVEVFDLRVLRMLATSQQA